MEGRRAEILRKGRDAGAAIGLFFFIITGIIPGFYFGSYGTLILLQKISGSPVEPDLLVRIIIVIGALTGIFSAGALTVVLGAVSGTAIAYAYGLIRYTLKPVEQRRQIIRRHGRISTERKEEILSGLSFLEPISDDIHSIALIGSTAYSLHERSSDIDVVVICSENGQDRVREFLFEKEIDGSVKNHFKCKYEFTVLAPSSVEKHFNIGSPFANVIRHGVTLKDDGYLDGIINSDYPLFPKRRYIIEALYEGIALQYYGSITKYEREFKEHHGESGRCTTAGSCSGHPPAGMIAKVIMSMLYITLPSRGYTPLTKMDVVDFAVENYGRESREALKKVAAILREDRETMTYDDYRLLKPLATTLFKEVLSIAGISSDVLSILRNSALIVRGDFEKITDEQYRKCVII